MGGRSIAYYTNYVYVATYNAGVQIISAADPSSMLLAGTISITSQCKGITVDGTKLYVSASESGVKVYDLASTPEAPTLITTLVTTGNARMVAVDENIVYIAAESQGVVIYDLTVPASPVLLTTIPLSAFGDVVHGVTYFNGKLWVAATAAGISCWDVNTPSSPVSVGGLDTPGSAYEVIGWDNDYVLVCDTYSLEIVPITDLQGVISDPTKVPSTFNVAGNFPNPFNPSTILQFSLPTTSEVTVAIYDATGRMVQEAFSGTLSQGQHSLTLNMGQFASGVYLAKVTTQQGQVAKRMVLLK